MLVVIRFAAVMMATLVAMARGYQTVGAMPSQTIGGGGMGVPIFEILPTQAPSLELVKRAEEKRALTNQCLDWTVLGGGVPVCYNSETCLFTTATDGYSYEGCGQTSVSYHWVTQCWPYPSTPSAGENTDSEIYCPATAPACGFYAFIYNDLNTFYNFGCSASSYSSLVVPAFSAASSSSDLILAGGGSSQLAITVTTTENDGTPTSITSQPPGLGTTNSLEFGSAPTSTSTSLPSIGSHTKKKKKTPIGAIVGGVVGGVVLIALALLSFFLARRSKKRKSRIEDQNHEQNQSMNNTSAYGQTSGVPELGGYNKPPTNFSNTTSPVSPTGTAGGYGEKPFIADSTQEYTPRPNVPQSTYSSELGTTTVSAASFSPPPTYSQPLTGTTPVSPEPSMVTELENRERDSLPPPVNPGSDYPDVAHTAPPANRGELEATHRPSEGAAGETGESLANSHTIIPDTPESGMGSTGGIATVKPARQSAVDMNGAPLSEAFHHSE